MSFWHFPKYFPIIFREKWFRKIQEAPGRLQEAPGRPLQASRRHQEPPGGPQEAGGLRSSTEGLLVNLGRLLVNLGRLLVNLGFLYLYLCRAGGRAHQVRPAAPPHQVRSAAPPHQVWSAGNTRNTSALENRLENCWKNAKNSRFSAPIRTFITPWDAENLAEAIHRLQEADCGPKRGRK